MMKMAWQIMSTMIPNVISRNKSSIINSASPISVNTNPTTKVIIPVNYTAIGSVIVPSTNFSTAIIITKSSAATNISSGRRRNFLINHAATNGKGTQKGK